MIKTILSFFFSLSISFSFEQCINTFPFSEDFEATDGGWASNGTNNDWGWGVPAKSVITNAGSGSKCWITGGTTISSYSANERSYIISPCFDFSSLANPVVAFKVFWEVEKKYDGGNLQYSSDGGATWKNVGSSNEPKECLNKNWYNEPNISNLNSPLVTVQNGWSGNVQSSSGNCQGGGGSGTWRSASHCLPALAKSPSVLFRFTFGAGTTCNDYDGFAIDSFSISEAPSISADFSYQCGSNKSYSFTSLTDSCIKIVSWNFGDGNSSNNTSTLLNPSHTFSDASTFTISLNISSGCYNPITATKQIKVPAMEIKSIAVSCNSDSDGKAYTVLKNIDSSSLISWNTNPGQTTDTAFNLSAGEYSVTLTTSDGCTLSGNTSVSKAFANKPYIGDDKPICPAEKIILRVDNFAAYEWQDGSKKQTFTATQPGTYFVLAKDSFGCESGDTIVIDDYCPDYLIFPTAFSPNNDGVNDIFKAAWRGNLVRYQLRIFNRYGEKIFESSSLKENWDGVYKDSPQPLGVFIYEAEYQFEGKTIKQTSGNFTLIR